MATGFSSLVSSMLSMYDCKVIVGGGAAELVASDVGVAAAATAFACLVGRSDVSPSESASRECDGNTAGADAVPSLSPECDGNTDADAVPLACTGTAAGAGIVQTVLGNKMLRVHRVFHRVLAAVVRSRNAPRAAAVDAEYERPWVPVNLNSALANADVAVGVEGGDTETMKLPSPHSDRMMSSSQMTAPPPLSTHPSIAVAMALNDR